VSQTTVSLVINGRESETVRIPPETRQRVLDVARTLGYVADPVARSLAGGTNRLIGVYTFESMFPMDHHDFYHPFLLGIEARAEELGYDLVLFTSAAGEQGRSIYRDGINRLRLADGCILLGKETNRDDIVRLRDEGFSFTLVGRRDIPGGDISYVTADYATATEKVVDHLASLGHRRIAYLPAADPSEPADDRDRGFETACTRLQLDVRDLVLPVTKESGPDKTAVERLLDAGATAFLAHESVVALRVLAILDDLGVPVPARCSVAALNDPPDGVSGPELTCFRIPRRDLGSRALDLLVHQIEAAAGETGPESTTLPCTFVAGETSGQYRGQE
jgi:DNA-binding LacI/PurR family transcriptional regulator